MERTKPRNHEKLDKVYSKYALERDLPVRWKMMAMAYVNNGWNKTQAYKEVYNDCSTDNTAAVQGNRILRNNKVRQYIAYIKDDFELLCGITKARQIKEYMKIAYSSIGKIHNKWTELAEYTKLTSDEKDAIESIEYKTEQRIVSKELVEVIYVKIKLHPKTIALQRIDKLMGYESATRLDISVEQPLFPD